MPDDHSAGGLIAGPWHGLAFRTPARKLIGGRILAYLWPTLPIPARLDPHTLSRDPAVNQAYAEDAAVHAVMTPGAWREIQWAQRAVVADGDRIESPLLFCWRAGVASWARTKGGRSPAPLKGARGVAGYPGRTPKGRPD